MNDNNIPKNLYKYTTAKTGIKILESSTIRFSNPTCFNDPYDSNIPIVFEEINTLTRNDISKIYQVFNNNQKLLPQNLNYNPEAENIDAEFVDSEPNARQILLKKTINQVISDMRILSLSTKYDNLLMWGHYAEFHTGIVIGFTTKQNSLTLRPIKYHEKIPKIKGKIYSDPLIRKAETMDEINTLLLTKGVDWEYEEEWRYSFSVKQLQNIYKLNKAQNINFLEELIANEKFIHHPFPPISVDRIYLGLNINPTYEDNIINLVKQKYPHSKVFKMSLNQTNFGLEVYQII